MIKKDNILNYLRDPKDKSVVARVIDLLEAAAGEHQPQVSDFYDPYYRNLINEVLPARMEVGYHWAGGYEEAERRRMVVYPHYFDSIHVDPQISCLKVSANMKFHKLSHRDYLGAILALGIKREKVGDLLPAEDGCRFVVDAVVASYIAMNLYKIGKATVKVEPIRCDELSLPPEKVLEIKTTVSSLRLDAVCSAGYGVSRSEASGDISTEKVKLNWAVTTDAAKKISAGDIISTRGRGRIRVDQVLGETRKGRIGLIIKKYL